VKTIIAFTKRLLPSLIIVSVTTFIVGFVSTQSRDVQASSPMTILSSTDFINTSMEKILPDTPKMISPADKLLVNGQSVMFAWHSAGEGAGYELVYSWYNNFESPETVVVKDTVYSLSFTNPVNTPLYWKIRTVTADKAYSQWTSVHSCSFIPVVNAWRCDGNCGSCPNPCGRRSKMN